ncbi:MAG: sensor histidine kinase [Candidatus Promineifilaceae bacterium]|jgi:signal transduction histidine kinase
MRSQVVKLTLAFLIVVLLGTVLVALLVNWQTRRQFDTFVQEIYQEDYEALYNQLADYSQAHGSWEGVEAEFVQDPPPYPGIEPVTDQQTPPIRLPLTLVDSERQVVFGDRRYPTGEHLPENVVAGGVPIVVDGETVGWVIQDSFGGRVNDFADSPEARFLADLNQTTLWAALGSAFIALLLGIVLARTISRPVKELEEGTRRVAQGQLGYRVSVRSQDEIGRLAGSFNQMSADLARSNELRRQMTADIAHDLGNPLSVIQGYAEALDENKLPGSPEIYQAIHQQASHLTRLVADLRTLSLADAGQLELRPQIINPQDLLEHSVLAYFPQAEEQKVALRLDVPQQLPDIRVDPDRIVQVLNNLISNALRHTPPGGEIRLSAGKDGRWLAIDVQDTGTGIAEEDLPYVFDRFYRGDKVRSPSGESGLGLAISRSIIEAHDGRISAASKPGQGATFTIKLPLP